MSAFSLFIPSVYANITAPMISETFHRMNVGHVKHIEFVPQNSNNGRVRQNKAYVFFDALYQSDLAMEIYNNVSNNITSKLPYGRSEHVFWVLLNSKRQYDGSSNNGEYVEPEFTEEEIAFMEEELDRQDREGNEDMSLVSADYANTLEQEIFKLRKLNAQLHASYITAFNSHQFLSDKIKKWTELGMNNQGDRLCSVIQRENQREEGEVMSESVGN